MNSRAVIQIFLGMEYHAAFIMLFWGNIALCVLVFSYVISRKDLENGKQLGMFALARAIQSFGWACFMAFELNPQGLFTVMGVLFGMLGFFLEARTLLSLSRLPESAGHLVRLFSSGFFVTGIALFALSRILPGSASLTRGAILACFVACAPGPLSLVWPGSTKLRTLIGYSCLTLFTAIAVWVGQTFVPGAIVDRPDVATFHDVLRIAIVMLTLTGGTGVLILSKEDADRKISELALRDPLTELYNRRHFIDEGLAVYADCCRNGDEVSVLFLDLDRFKTINDRFGHHFGDAVLRDFAALVRVSVRPLDFACRYGGEEFVVLLPRTGRNGALAVANRLLDAVRRSKFPDRLDFSYTVSAGIAHAVPETGKEGEFLSLIEASDEALYRAKAEGRDRVVCREDFS